MDQLRGDLLPQFESLQERRCQGRALAGLARHCATARTGRFTVQDRPSLATDNVTRRHRLTFTGTETI